ncbi:hypothetical protein [Cellulomonas endophytica]|uniref:hypothetical protein n=1 Tax=Cellulomonas endophytica TaxID=2494735 RepID=UPI0010112C3B|nr:hypothetical protein [Cellulomonas endophytica]
MATTDPYLPRQDADVETPAADPSQGAPDPAPGFGVGDDAVPATGGPSAADRLAAEGLRGEVGATDDVEGERGDTLADGFEDDDERHDAVGDGRGFVDGPDADDDGLGPINAAARGPV